MFKKIVLILIVLFAGLLVYVGMQSSSYTITRKITINANPEKIFPYLNNAKLAEQWGPWEEVDPQAVMVYSGASEGVGARTPWDSAGQLGTGSATIVESNAYTRFPIRLEYTKPMMMTQDSEYVIEPAGEQSVVTWKVAGQNTFLGRLMCVFIS